MRNKLNVFTIFSVLSVAMISYFPEHRTNMKFDPVFSSSLHGAFLRNGLDTNITPKKKEEKKSTADEKKPVSTKPDILFFIADDMTSIDCEPYGNPDVKTPNLSKLAMQRLTPTMPRSMII